MQSFHHFVPPKSIKLLQCWIDELGVKVVIAKPRKTKLGDFKVKGGRMIVSVNNNLNPYSFLITLTHELAHAFVYRDYIMSKSPHAEEWQLTFKSMLLSFLTPDYFPSNVLSALSLYVIKPKASTLSDIKLSSVLRTYDTCKTIVISDINEGEEFSIANGRLFIKGPKLRRRFRCVEKHTKKVYLFHPLSDVIRIQ